MSRTATDTEIILLVEAIHDAIIAGGGGGGSGTINVGTGNVGDLVKVTDTAGTTFGRVTVEEIATEVLEVETINFVQPDTLIPVTKQIPLLNTDGKLDSKFFYVSNGRLTR